MGLLILRKISRFHEIDMNKKLSSTAECRLKYLQNNPREALAMIAIVKRIHWNGLHEGHLSF